MITGPFSQTASYRANAAVRRVAALFAAVLLAVAVFAQSAGEIESQAKAAYDQKEYAKSARLYLQAYKLDSKKLLALYNGACSFALSGQKDEAIAALQELASKGYNNPAMLEQDTDFASVRSDTRWTGILEKVKENAKKNPPRPLWKKPYQVLEAPKEAGDLAAKLGSETEAVWLEGDVLTFLCKGSAPQMQLAGGVQDPMTKIPGSDLWILRAQMPGWDKAFVSYAFIGAPGPVHLKVWKGENAPQLPEKAATLQGKIVEKTYHSDSMGEDRKVIVYLPPNAPAKDLPAVFLADGGACKEFAAVLEPLILAHKVRPCAIVGIPSGAYLGKPGEPYDPNKDLRAREYVPGQDADRFAKHMKFFTQEVGAFVAKDFGISTRREDRAVTGFSNGGAFSAAVAYRMPEFFGISMPLSLGVPPTDPKPASPLPKMFFAAGTLESFIVSTTRVYEQVKGWGVESSMDVYPAGHDPEMWHLAFSRMMPKAFPG